MDRRVPLRLVRQSRPPVGPVTGPATSKRAPVWIAGVLVVATLAAACGSSAPTAAGPTTTVPSTVPPTTVPPTTTTTVPPTTTTTTEQPGWTLISLGPSGAAADERTLSGPSGAPVTVVRFRAGRVRFNLHVGSQDPPVDSVAIPADGGPVIAADEAPSLLAAFNGGFKMSAGAGGFEVQGQTLAPLVPGEASFVIDTDGVAHVGVWGQDLPAPGEAVTSVRQNLAPLVIAGRPSAAASVVGDWGATLGGGAAVARSAVGQDAEGNIIFAAGMSVIPSDLAAALVDVGAVTGMELDINPEWVQLDAASAPGGALSAMIPGQDRPANQYQAGWTRDFITVLATG